jgi:hypothetical protein
MCGGIARDKINLIDVDNNMVNRCRLNPAASLMAMHASGLGGRPFTSRKEMTDTVQFCTGYQLWLKSFGSYQMTDQFIEDIAQKKTCIVKILRMVHTQMDCLSQSMTHTIFHEVRQDSFSIQSID